MSDPADRDEAERARELSRLWQSTVVPLDAHATQGAREARIVSALGATIAKTWVRRGHERNVRRGLAIAIASIAAIVLLGLHLRSTNHDQERAKLDARDVGTVKGRVTLVHGSSSRVVDGAGLALGDRVSTDSTETAELSLSRLVRATVESSTDLAISTPNGSTHRLKLDRGEIQARVDDRPSPIPKLIIETPNVEVVVTGTIFDVSVTRSESNADATTRVSVAKGRIVIKKDGAPVAAVTAGQTWTSREAPATALSPPPERSPNSARQPAMPETWSPALAEQNRSFQAAMDARNRHDDHAAIALLGELLARYPTSPLARDAKIERLRAYERLGLATEARKEAARYLSDYPDGFAHDEAERIVHGGATPVLPPVAPRANDSRTPPSQNFPDP